MRKTIHAQVVSVALLVLAACGGSQPVDAALVNSAAIHYPEIWVVNDYSRYRSLLADTEKDAGDRFIVANLSFARSATLKENTLQLLLVGQTTFTNSEQDVNVLTSTGEIVVPDTLLNLVEWRQRELLAGRIGLNDAVILLTRRSLAGGVAEASYLWQMCSPAAVGIVQTGYALEFDAVSIARAVARLVGVCSDPPGDRNSCRALPVNLAFSTACTFGVMEASRSPHFVSSTFSECSAFDLDDWIQNRAPSPSCLTQPARVAPAAGSPGQ